MTGSLHSGRSINLHNAVLLITRKLKGESALYAKIYTRNPKTCTIFIPAGAQIGDLQVFFSIIKIAMIRLVRMLPACIVV